MVFEMVPFLALSHMCLLACPKGGGQAVHQWCTKPKTEWKAKGQGDGRRESPDRGIFHLKALLSYRSSIKTERREEICENGFTKFPSLSMNSLSIEHYERGEREGGRGKM